MKRVPYLPDSDVIVVFFCVESSINLSWVPIMRQLIRHYYTGWESKLRDFLCSPPIAHILTRFFFSLSLDSFYMRHSYYFSKNRLHRNVSEYRMGARCTACPVVPLKQASVKYSVVAFS